MHTLLQRLFGAIGFLERIVIGIAAIMMLAIMFIVSADVFMRYALNSPLSYGYDLISLYLMAGVFFLTLSHAHADQAHVKVDILQKIFPLQIKRLCECIITALAFAVFALMADFGFARAADAYRAHDVVAGAISWPTWPSAALVPLGAGLLCLRLAVQFIRSLASFFADRDLIPAAVGVHDAEEGFE